MDESRPLISVIVPFYNVEPYLGRCLDSILGQSYPNLEILLVDDGSTDGSGAIADGYAAGDDRIQVIHKENGGVATARNVALARATGAWIGWVDSDDWIEPDMFESLLDNALAQRAEIAVCSRYEVYRDKKVYRGWDAAETLDTEGALKQLLENDKMQNFLWDKLWRRDLFEDIQFPEGRNYEDVAVMHRLFLRARRVVCLPGAKYNYVQRPGSIIANTTLKNRMYYYQAARERYEEMGGRWPELDPLLLGQCAVSAVGLWCAWCDNPRADRQAMLPQLEEIAAFCAPHTKGAAESLGLAGRMVLRLVPYPRWWAFRLAWIVSKLYEVKHGRPM